MVTELSRILVAVDFSPSARRAFDRALALSQRHGAELMTVHAVPKDERFDSNAKARMRLRKDLQRQANSAGVTLRPRVQQGDAVDIVLLHAETWRPDVIVLGTQQRTGLDRLTSRSVAERVSLQADQPVLIVPERDAIQPATRFDDILVAVDFSAASLKAVEHVFALARPANTRVTLVHVVPGSSAPSDRRFQTQRAGLAEYERFLNADAWRRLQEVAARHEHVADVRARVVRGNAATEVARVAAEIRADLIVVGVPSRSAIARTLLGSTTMRLLRTAGSPILAVPDSHDSVQGRGGVLPRAA